VCVVCSWRLLPHRGVSRTSAELPCLQVILPFYDSKDKARTKYIIHTVRGLPFVYGLSVFDGKREKLVVFRVTPKATGKCFYALQTLGVCLHLSPS
jgi:hypothetical protein